MPAKSRQPPELAPILDELAQIERAAKDAAKLEVVIGILEPEASEPKMALKDGGKTRYVDYSVTLGQTVLLNEYGGTNQTGARIPARPSLRNTADTLHHYASYREHEMWDPWAQPDPAFWLHDLGQAAVPLTKTNIERWQDPPNAMRTILQKGFDNPLIATRQFVDSIRFDVRKKRSDAVKP